MFEKFKYLLMSKAKKENFRKEQIRGTIKQIMRVRGLRSISVRNYDAWKKNVNENPWLHSMKLNLMDGYLYFYDYNHTNTDSPRSGAVLEDMTIDQYNEAYNKVENILAEEENMPTAVKRNILVKVSR